MRPGLLHLLAASMLTLTACGESPVSPEGQAAASALKGLDESKIAALLSTEAKAALDILGQGARTELAAYQAEYGKLPANLSELASLQAARAVAVTAVADGLSEQLPFVSRGTLEQVAGQFVDRGQQRLFEQLKAEAAANPSESLSK